MQNEESPDQSSERTTQDFLDHCFDVLGQCKHEVNCFRLKVSVSSDCIVNNNAMAERTLSTLSINPSQPETCLGQILPHTICIGTTLSDLTQHYVE